MALNVHVLMFPYMNFAVLPGRKREREREREMNIYLYVYIFPTCVSLRATDEKFEKFQQKKPKKFFFSFFFISSHLHIFNNF